MWRKARRFSYRPPHILSPVDGMHKSTNLGSSSLFDNRACKRMGPCSPWGGLRQSIVRRLCVSLNTYRKRQGKSHRSLACVAYLGKGMAVHKGNGDASNMCEASTRIATRGHGESKTFSHGKKWRDGQVSSPKEVT